MSRMGERVLALGSEYADPAMGGSACLWVRSLLSLASTPYTKNFRF